MKSIKDLASELGVSKTAVNKKIDNLGLRSCLQKNGNQFLIDETTETLIKSTFAKSEPQINSKTANRKPVGEFENQLALLQEELRRKNEQIDQLLEQNRKLLDTVDNNSNLLASLEEDLKAEIFLKVQAEKRVLELEDKLTEPKKGFWNIFKK